MKQCALNKNVKICLFVRVNYLYFIQTLLSIYNFPFYINTNLDIIRWQKSLIPKRLTVKEMGNFPIAHNYMKYDCSFNRNKGCSTKRVFILCVLSVAPELENLIWHHILLSKGVQEMQCFVAMLQVSFCRNHDWEENFWMAATGARVLNVQPCEACSCDVEAEPQLGSSCQDFILCCAFPST